MEEENIENDRSDETKLSIEPLDNHIIKEFPNIYDGKFVIQFRYDVSALLFGIVCLSKIDKDKPSAGLCNKCKFKKCNKCNIMYKNIDGTHLYSRCDCIATYGVPVQLIEKCSEECNSRCFQKIKFELTSSDLMDIYNGNMLPIKDFNGGNIRYELIMSNNTIYGLFGIDSIENIPNIYPEAKEEFYKYKDSFNIFNRFLYMLLDNDEFENAKNRIKNIKEEYEHINLVSSGNLTDNELISLLSIDNETRTEYNILTLYVDIVNIILNNKEQKKCIDEEPKSYITKYTTRINCTNINIIVFIKNNNTIEDNQNIDKNQEEQVQQNVEDNVEKNEYQEE